MLPSIVSGRIEAGERLQLGTRDLPCLTFVLACFGLFAWASWGKLGDLIIDMGHEVEVPARMLMGQLLYRDIEVYYGPLAYYSNALMLAIFGHRLEVFYGVGLTLALAATLLVYILAARLMNAQWATLCTVCVLLYCTFSPGLFNFVVPYSYGSVYATVLCLFAIFSLDRYARTGTIGWLATAGLTCGLAGLAKQEYGVAALGGVLVGAYLCPPYSLRARSGRTALILAVAGASVLLPLALLAHQVSWEEIKASLLPTAKFGVFARSSLFQVSPGKTLALWWETLRVFLPSFLVVFGVVAFTGRLDAAKWIPSTRLRALIELLVSIALSLGALFVLKKLFTVLGAATGFRVEELIVFDNHPLNYLQWLLPLLTGWFILKRRELQRHEHAPLLWTLLIYALLLNARWLFYIEFYGLYATPAVVLFFVFLYHLTAKLDVRMWQSLLVCLLIGVGLRLVHFGQYPHTVSSARGTFYTRDAGLARAFNQTIDAVEASGATSVLVVPEGLVLNFLTATRSPGRETDFLPGSLPTPKAEQDFLEHMRADPPELIIYVERPLPEWQYQSYAEFNPLVYRWITQQHRMIHLFPKGENAIRIYASKE